MLELRKFFQVVKQATMLQTEIFNEKKQLFFIFKNPCSINGTLDYFLVHYAAPQGDIQMLTNIVHKSSFVHSFPSINLCRSLMLEKSPAKPKTMYVRMDGMVRHSWIISIHFFEKPDYLHMN